MYDESLIDFFLNIECMEIRKTNQNDLEGLLKIYESSREFMLDNDNPVQWGDSYPDEKMILSDIENDHHFVCVDGNRLLGCFAFIEGDDPTYKLIVKGKWLDNNPYAAIHRLAVLERRKGIGSTCIKWCFNKHNNIRIDTHKANIPMQKLLEKEGFQYCGVIFTQQGDERLAFQKIK